MSTSRLRFVRDNQVFFVMINREEGWVEIKHEEIKGLMPAMTMEFFVKTRSLLNEVQVGDRVDFTVVETGKGEFITELKKIQTAQ